MRIAQIQMPIESASRSTNLANALKRIDEAAELTPSPDIICLPGCADYGWPRSEPVLPADACGGPFIESLALKARDLGVFLMVGHVDADFRASYIGCSLIDSDGDAVLRHRAIHLDAPAKKLYATGRTLRTCETIFGRVGLLCGWDLDSHCLVDALSCMGAPLVLVAGTAGMEPDRAALAKSSKVTLVDTRAASANGDGSAVFGPDGRVLASADAGDESIVCTDLPKKTAPAEPVR